MAFSGGAGAQTADKAGDAALLGHWKLRGDCQDHSGNGRHAINHGVDLQSAEFDGAADFVEIPADDSPKLGARDFAICAWVQPGDCLDDVVGDVLDWYDPDLRRGVTLSIGSSAGGYQAPGSDKHVYFGIDNAQESEWRDCGRPSATSNYVSNSLTVFDGHLYAATMDAADERDWRHVYRYDGDDRWIDCGQVGDARCTGIGPLVVHHGSLYAATCTYDWTRVQQGDYAPGRVYRYAGGKTWIDCGEPSDSRTLNGAASFRGKLYVGGGPSTWGVFELGDDGQWSAARLFAKQGRERCFPHAMGRHNGRLYVGFQSVHAFDGANWTFLGFPAATPETLQTHSLTVYQGQLCAGTWPEAEVALHEDGERWRSIGRVGDDGTEVNALLVYNGKLYGGSIPRAEVCRFDGQPRWSSMQRFYSPPGWTPVPPSELGGNPTREELNEWSRVTSLTVYGGRMFASIGSCTSSVQDAPCDVRGKVFSMEAGKCASFDGDLGTGWRHLAAVRDGNRLKLHVDGRLVAESSEFNPDDYDLSTDRPLCIGRGQTDWFNGKIADVRLYGRALTPDELQSLASDAPE